MADSSTLAPVEFPYTETTSAEKRGVGRPTDPNALVPVSVRLPSSVCDYIDKWEGSTRADRLRNMIEYVRLMQPQGEPRFARRDELGRFCK